MIRTHQFGNLMRRQMVAPSRALRIRNIHENIMSAFNPVLALNQVDADGKNYAFGAFVMSRGRGLGACPMSMEMRAFFVDRVVDEAFPELWCC